MESNKQSKKDGGLHQDSKSKRNAISEIIDVKNRQKFNADLYTRLNEINNSFNKYCENKNNFEFKELIKYFPIGIVALYEAYFKSIIKELIDSGKQYVDNIDKFNNSSVDKKLDLAVLANIYENTFTLGEFIAHMLPTSNFEYIISHLTNLIGKNFLDELKEFSNFDRASVEMANFKGNCDKIIGNVYKIFELRHIFCHESIPTDKIKTDSIIEKFKDAVTFIKAADHYFEYLLYPHSESFCSYSERYQGIREEYKSSNEILKKSINLISKNLDGICLKKFKKANNYWFKYRQEIARTFSYECKGGRLEALIFFGELINVTKERIRKIKKDYHYLFNKPVEYNVC